MSPKLIFFDIDGTLAMPGHEVSQEVKEALKKARENGNYLFINTGRTHKDIPPFIKELDFDGGVYSAGGKVDFKDQTIFEKALTQKELNKIRKVLDSLDIDYTLEGKKANYSVNTNEFKMSEEEIAKLSTELQRFIRTSSGMSVPKRIDEYNGEPVYKINFRINEKESEKINEVNKELSNDFRIDYFTNIFSGLGTIAAEITNFNINKGNGIKELCNYLEIPIEDTIAFGDSTNDMDMIKTAHIGVAMGNASDDIKEVANIICENCLDNGIAKTLKRLEII